MNRKASSSPFFHFLPNESGNPRRTTDGENGPLCIWFLNPKADRKSQPKFLQKETENEFDNGYYEKIREITEQEENFHPISQLMEKQSTRSTDNSPAKFWFTNSQRDATEREEEIKNKLIGEDGDIYNDQVDFVGGHNSDVGSCSCLICTLRRIQHPKKKPYSGSDQTEAKLSPQSSLKHDHQQLGKQSSYQKIAPKMRSNADTSELGPIDKENKLLQKPMKETLMDAAPKQESKTLPNDSNLPNSFIQDVPESKTSWNIPSNLSKKKTSHASRPETPMPPKKAVAETSVEENKDRKGCKPDFSSIENQDTCSEKDKPIRSQDTHDKEIADNKPLIEHKPPNHDSSMDTKKRLIQLDDGEKYYSLEEDGDSPDSELSLDSEMFDMTEDDEYLYDDYDSDYTLDSLMPHNSSAAQNIFGSSGYVDKGGRYSKGISQFVNMPTFMQSIRKFASDNLFELRDVVPDGNCMFRAIADQLHINGDLGYNCKILRRQAVRYLRYNPCQSDGSRLEDFLSTESWEHYLQRMEQNYQWGDHMVLKAMADALNLVVVVFNVYEDDIRRTEILSEGRPITKRQKLTIFLGHIGEFHYLSLRPIDWEKDWPYKSLIRRLQVNCLTEDKAKLMGWIEQKIGRAATKKYIKDVLSEGKNATNKHQMLEPNIKCHFLKYGLQHQILQLEDEDETLKTIVSDSMSVDRVTGLTMPHFSYVLKKLFAYIPIVTKKPSFNPELKFFVGGINVNFELYGAAADGTNVCLRDASKGRKMQYYEYKKTTNFPSFIVCDIDVELIFSKTNEDTLTECSVCVDESDTHAGYCRLKPVFDNGNIWITRRVRSFGSVYLKAMDIPENVKHVLKEKGISKYFWGYKCPSFPPSVRKEWQSEERSIIWPSAKIRQDILSSDCLIIQRAHPSSCQPEVEWKFLFSQGEKLLFKKGLTKVQKDTFSIFKLLIEHMNHNVPRPLKQKHMKSVFFYACEQIKHESWEDNPAGCMVYLLSDLLKCVKKRCIPHYFIARNNLLDYYSDEEVQALCVHIEALRVFPIQCIEHLFDAYGWGFILRNGMSVLKDCEHFERTRDIKYAWEKVFIPANLKSIMPLIKLKLYDDTYIMLKTVYEEVFLAPLPDPPSFQDMFLEALSMVEDASAKKTLAALYDKDCGSDFLGQIKADVVFVRDVLSGDIDEQIGCMEIPKSVTQNQILIAGWLDDKAYVYYNRGDFEMSKKLLLTAINCAKRLLKGQNELEINDIEDDNLRDEIYQQKYEQSSTVISELHNNYVHLFCVCVEPRDLEIIREHLKDLETYRQSHPNIDDLIQMLSSYLTKRESGFFNAPMYRPMTFRI